MPELALPEAFQDELRTAWQRYIDLVAPFRPDLYRYPTPAPGKTFETS